MITRRAHIAVDVSDLAEGIQPFGLMFEGRALDSSAVSSAAFAPIGGTWTGLSLMHPKSTGSTLIELAEHPHEGHR